MTATDVRGGSLRPDDTEAQVIVDRHHWTVSCTGCAVKLHRPNLPFSAFWGFLTLEHWGVPRLDGARGKKPVWRPPCSNLRSFGSKFTIQKKVRGTFRRRAHYAPLSLSLRPYSRIMNRYSWWSPRECAYAPESGLELKLFTCLFGKKKNMCWKNHDWRKR